ncbi:MAG: AAA family ATPase, partial [Bacteroidales bacterium]|nr:AAA family ATPase [Bacteroidales bacterium]
KEQSKYIRFIFLTGITKFTRLSLFSVLNNIKVNGFWPEYQAICGITDEEVRSSLRPYVLRLSEQLEMTEEETYQVIKDHYDGYHFCENGIDVYNPYSLINSLNDGEINDYWAMSGNTKMLMDAVDRIGWDEDDFSNIAIDKQDLRGSDVNDHNLPLFMYQSGYLTIKSSDKDFYYLGVPNAEVHRTISKQILPRLVGKSENNINANIILIKKALRRGLVSDAMEAMKALVAGTPYSKDNTPKAMEDKFQFIVKNAMYLCGCDVLEEQPMAKGRADLVCRHDTCILVIELKMAKNGGIEAAELQISDRDYTSPFMAQSKPVYAIAIEFDAEKRCMTRHKVVRI